MTYGGEAALTWQALEAVRIYASYGLLKFDLSNDSGAENLLGDRDSGSSPKNQVKVRSNVDLPYELEFDTLAWYVDSLSVRDVDSYIRLDFRVGWRPDPQFDLSIGLQNVLENDHKEYGDDVGTALPSEVPRSILGKATVRF